VVQVLLQIHDALLVQYPEEAEAEVLPQVLRLIQVPVELNGGRRLIIPSEAKVGWNWGSWSEANPNGLKKYTGSETRTRQREGGPSASILDNRFL
jgi:hypothetical protein